MKKRHYTKPLIEVNRIDNEISLVMMSADEGTPPDEVLGAASETTPELSSSSTFDDNPFGE